MLSCYFDCSLNRMTFGIVVPKIQGLDAFPCKVCQQLASGLNTYGWSKMTVYNASHLLWQQIQTDVAAPSSTWGQAVWKSQICCHVGFVSSDSCDISHLFGQSYVQSQQRCIVLEVLSLKQVVFSSPWGWLQMFVPSMAGDGWGMDHSASPWAIRASSPKGPWFYRANDDVFWPQSIKRWSTWMFMKAKKCKKKNVSHIFSPFVPVVFGWIQVKNAEITGLPMPFFQRTCRDSGVFPLWWISRCRWMCPWNIQPGANCGCFGFVLSKAWTLIPNQSS